MIQTRLQSLLEAAANIAIGYVVNFIGNWLILPLFGFNVTLGQNLLIGVLFTGISVARQYVLRRYFNARLADAARRAANNLTKASA